MKQFAVLAAAVLTLTGLTACRTQNPPPEPSAPLTSDTGTLPAEPQSPAVSRIRCYPNAIFSLPQDSAYLVPEQGGDLLLSADGDRTPVLTAGFAYRNLFGLSDGDMAARVIAWYLSEPGESPKAEPLDSQTGIRLSRVRVGQDAPAVWYLVQHGGMTYALLLSSVVSPAQQQAVERLLAQLTIEPDGNAPFRYDPQTDSSDDTPYCYGVLSAEDRRIYDEICTELTADSVGTGKVLTYPCASQAEAERFDRIVYGVSHDREEQTSYMSFDTEQKNGTYRIKAASVRFDHSEDLELRDTVSRKTDAILGKMPAGLTRYGKYLYLADALCDMCQYDFANEDVLSDPSQGLTLYPYGLRGPFEDGAAVCFGYAHAYTALCSHAGLFCNTIVAGEHAWNLIRLNGEYYYLDVTWMDNSEGRRDSIYNLPFTKDEPGHADYLKIPRCGPIMYDEYLDILRQTGTLDWEAEAILRPIA